MRKSQRITMLYFKVVTFGLAATAVCAQQPPVSHGNGPLGLAVASGRTLFERSCAPCHDGEPGRVGTAVLARRLGRDKSVLERRTDLTADYVKRVVRSGLNAMPAFRFTELSASEVDAIAEYLASRPTRVH